MTKLVAELGQSSMTMIMELVQVSNGKSSVTAALSEEIDYSATRREDIKLSRQSKEDRREKHRTGRDEREVEKTMIVTAK